MPGTYLGEGITKLSKGPMAETNRPSQVTDDDADFGKSPISPLLNSVLKVVSPVLPITMGWLRRVV